MVTDERYEDITFHALPTEYEMVRTASCNRWDFRLHGIRHIVHAMYADNLWRSFNATPVAGCGIAMQVVGKNSSDVKGEH